MTNLRNMLQNSADDLDTAIERECWEDVSIIVAYMRIALEAQPLAGTPHPFPYLCAICGLPPSAHSPVEPPADPNPLDPTNNHFRLCPNGHVAYSISFDCCPSCKVVAMRASQIMNRTCSND